ncbi:DUF429 domain-containing protein [Pseudonocardia lacus]|uniref:DUF429 domain-containing protein n=1 Tax=Pseudonocardia lacus TaxID=2835865 RepID=UPI001BDC642F|nr:DUF429 domain-containing protein [Pseudonocardia lacus]
MRTAGIDLAAADKNTAACVIDWAGDRTSVRFETDTSDEGLLRICGEVDKVGIDCPFGWPVPFVEAILAHRNREPWPGRGLPAEGFRRRLKFRLTDEHVWRKIKKAPLSVSADKIAVPAMRCALLLDALGSVDRTGVDGRVAEVYPVASLHAWRLPTKGLKKPEDWQHLPERLDMLVERFTELAAGRGRWERRVARDHEFDALVCALTAREVREGRTEGPEPGEAAERAAVEGWIHIPRPR